jgi:5'-deoxynucleotidase YfbR-like HD superfamily hydrolase
MTVIDEQDKLLSNASRVGDWMTTYTGKAMYPLDPKSEEIELLDIAHSLSLQTRFNGMGNHFYSVAEHSVRCADYLWVKYHNPVLARVGLFHDAAEAYVGDMPRPLKLSMPDFKRVEDGILKVIFEKFNLPWPMPDEYKEADEAWLGTEARALLGTAAFSEWVYQPAPVPSDMKLEYGTKLKLPWEMWRAQERFLEWATRSFA